RRSQPDPIAAAISPGEPPPADDEGGPGARNPSVQLGDQGPVHDVEHVHFADPHALDLYPGSVPVPYEPSADLAGRGHLERTTVGHRDATLVNLITGGRDARDGVVRHAGGPSRP